MIELRGVEVPRAWDDPRVLQVVQAMGQTFVFSNGARSEVVSLGADGTTRSTRSPFMAPSLGNTRRMAVLGDGSLAVVDRTDIHVLGTEGWSTVPGPGMNVRAWGESAEQLVVVTGAHFALAERTRRGWSEPRFANVSNRDFDGLHGRAGQLIAVGTEHTHSKVLVRREGQWWQHECGARFLGDARIFGAHHAAVFTSREVHVNRGLAWDRIALGRGAGSRRRIDFVTSLRGHTLIGGLEGPRRAWIQIGRRALYHLELEGPPAAPPGRTHWLTLLPDGRLALAGDSRVWISEPVWPLGERAESHEMLEPARDRSRTVRVPASVGASSTEGDAHAVAAFEIDRAPVSNREWASVAASLGLAAPKHWRRGRMPPGREDHPVVNVPYEHAARYAASRGMRLPTEDEWERAAAGTDGRRFVHGDEAPERAVVHAPVLLRTRALTSRAPTSPFGLEHVSLVWEWTSTAHDQGHIVRGGPFRERADAAEIGNRSAQVGPAPDVGFRCARTPDPARDTQGASPYR